MTTLTRTTGGSREAFDTPMIRDFGFAKIWVPRSDDPKRTMSGKEVGPRWAEAVTHRLRKPPQEPDPSRFLFKFLDIGTAGVHRWLRIRSRYSRTLMPLIPLVDSRSIHLETQLAQVGIALEALGYQIAVDEGGNELNSRGQLSYQAALDLIVRELNVVPVDDLDDWKARSRVCYMEVKHADNRPPDALTSANTLRESLLISAVGSRANSA